MPGKYYSNLAQLSDDESRPNYVYNLYNTTSNQAAQNAGYKSVEEAMAAGKNFANLGYATGPGAVTYEYVPKDKSVLKPGDSITGVNSQNPDLLHLAASGVGQLSGSNFNITGQYQSPYAKMIADLMDKMGTSSPSTYETDLQAKLLAEQSNAKTLADQRLAEELRQLEESRARQLSEVKDIGNRSMGTSKRILGRAGGFTTSTGAGLLANEEQKVVTNLGRINTAIDNAKTAANAAFKENASKTAIANYQASLEDLAKERANVRQDQQDRINNLIKLSDLQIKSANDAYDKLSPLVAQQLTGDATTDWGTINDISSQYGLDPMMFYGQIQQWQVDNQTENKPISIGGKLVKLNPETGQYEEVYQGEEDYGAQYKEWQAYKKEGGKLSFPDYQNMDANRKRSVSGGGGSNTSLVPGMNSKTSEKFWEATNAAFNELQQGADWGATWKKVQAQFPNAPADYIDIGLHKSEGWSDPGHYQYWMGQKKGSSRSL